MPLQASPAPKNPAGFEIRRGVNLSHWLSQDFGWAPRETVVTENDLRYIASLGFDHVRLPVDEKELWDDAGKPIEPAFALLEKALGWAAASKLRVIVDLHTVRSHHFNASNEGLTNTLWTDPKAQASFIDLWVQLSARLIHHPVSQVAYEIMNEPVADDHEDWNRLIAASLKVLRVKEPNRVVVLGANRWQIPPSMPFLKVPEGDKNIILSVHSYSPFIFTHYTADWTPLKNYRGKVGYPGLPMPKADHEKIMAQKNRELSDLVGNAGEEWNKARIAQEFAPAIKRARELGLQLYCGEWGCLPTVPRKDRLAYYRDFVDAIEENGMAWANWEYKGDFGIFEWHHASLRSGAPDVEMIEALLGKR